MSFQCTTRAVSSVELRSTDVEITILGAKKDGRRKACQSFIDKSAHLFSSFAHGRLVH